MMMNVTVEQPNYNDRRHQGALVKLRCVLCYFRFVIFDEGVSEVTENIDKNTRE